MTNDLSTIIAGLDSVRAWQEQLYKDLHEHPELSHQEERTARLVADRLRRDGCEVHEDVGGTGVVGVLDNGPGPTVLLRADMDALPVREATGLPYASQALALDADGTEVPVMHACGHDVHVASLLGAMSLLAGAPGSWAGTVVAVFQPGEELGDGARRMVDDGLAELVGDPAVALCQHVLPLPAGQVATRVGPTLSTADSMRITVHGRGAHGSMPHAAVDPVVLAALIVVRLQTVISRETRPGNPAVLTVGSLRAGTKSNIIPDRADIALNVRSYDEQTRTAILDAIQRIVTAECEASGSPRPPEFELFDHFPLTDNDAETTHRVSAAFQGAFGPAAVELPLQTASEDFSDIPTSLGIPYTYWGVGGMDPATYARAEAEGRIAQDVPVNHSATFAPVLQPTLDTATTALVVATLAWVARPDRG